jgi:hypothetical protein
VGSIRRRKSTVLLFSARLIPGQIACCRGNANGLNVESEPLAAGDARVSIGSVRSPSELGSEQSEPLHRSARCHVPLLIIVHLSFSFLLISRPLTALCPTISTLQSCNTRRKRPMHTNHSPSRSLPSYFLFFPPLTPCS